MAASATDPLGLLFRLVVLRGARRGEAVGLRWSGADLDAGYLTVERPILLVGAIVIEGTPKSRAGERLIWLDAEKIRLLREHRRAQLAARLQAGSAWQDKLGAMFEQVAEADGNRTRRRRRTPPTGFEDRGGHQAPGRLRA